MSVASQSSSSNQSLSSPAPSNSRLVKPSEVLGNPKLLSCLTARVYDLLLQDLRQEQERLCGYGSWRR